MDKKRIFFPLKDGKFQKLKNKIGSAERLQYWVNTVPKTKIHKLLGVSEYLLNRLCKEWNIRPRKSGSLSTDGLEDLREFIRNYDQDA